MEFNINKFLYIAVWVLAIGTTLASIAGALGMYWYHNSMSGKLELLRMQLKGQVPGYRWKVLWIAVFAWIAVFCFS